MLEQRRLDNELKLEKLRIQAEQKRISREMNEARREEQIMTRLKELERLIVQTAQEKPGEHPPALPAQSEEEKAAAPAPSPQKQKLYKKNRQTALKLFRAKLSGARVVKGKTIPVFPDKKLCEEYLEYNISLPDYCRNFLAELDSGSVAYLSHDQGLTYYSDNGEDLLPSADELAQFSPQDEDAAHFEKADATLRYLEENAQVMGLVEITTDSGQRYWMTYRDLSTSAQKEAPPEK